MAFRIIVLSLVHELVPDKTLVFKFNHGIICSQYVAAKWTVYQVQINVTAIKPSKTQTNKQIIS